MAKKVNKKEEKIKEVKEKDAVQETEEEIVIKKITEESEKKRLVSMKNVLFAVGGLVIGVAVSVLFISRVPKLSNGDEVVVSLKDKSYSAQSIYDELKPQYALNTVLRNIDLDLVKAYFNGSKDEEAAADAEEQAETYINQYTAYGYTEESFLSYYGFSTKDEFIDYLTEDYLLNEYFEEYVKSTITDDQVEEFYSSYAMGKKKVYIFSETSSTTNLDAIRKALKKGTSISDVVDKYSSKVTVQDGVEIDISSISSYSDTMVGYIKSTEAGKYTKVFSDDTYGNVVIYVESAEETPSYEDAKDDILDALVSEAQSADSNLYYKAFIELRKENKIKFYDADLKKQYSEYVANYTGTTDDDTTDSSETTTSSSK